LYERHVGLGTNGFKFYYGAGAHINHQYNRKLYYDSLRDRYVYRYTGSAVGLGIDGIVGLDYKIPAIPLALSVDLKPFAEVNNYGDLFFAADPSLGIKLAF
jgi:hypothetical protein